MRDSRALFENMTQREETTWDTWELPAQALDDERMRILLKLPRKQVAWESSPMDSIFYKLGEKNAERLSKNIPLEWVVERMGEGEDQLQYFYVNNEGFDYSRYTFRFEPRAV